MSPAETLRARIAAPDLLVIPGIYDALTASLAAQAGFGAAFVSGSALAAAQLGRPDVGLFGLTETADIVARIADRISIPLLVDADQGFGNELMVARTVQVLERAGASAIQIEDQTEVKAASAPLARPLIERNLMADKVKRAKDSCRNPATIISARTDAVSSEGIDAAIERATAYRDAGADMVFIESLTTRKDMEKAVAAIGTDTPKLHNLIRPGDEVLTADEVQRIGYQVLLFPALVPSAAARATAAALAELKAEPALKQAGGIADLLESKDYLASFTD